MAVVIKKLEKNLGKVAILIIYSIIAFFFIVNGEGLFDAWGTNWTFNSLIYFVGVAAFVTAVDELPEELKTDLSTNVIAFSAAALFALLFLLIARDFGLMFQSVSPMPSHLIPANMAFHGVIVAPSEEIIFRGVIFGYLYDRFKLRPQRQTGEVKRYGWVIPYFGSSGIFALFHLAVYGPNLIQLTQIFAIGMIFAYATERWGLGAAIGGHWIWNCMAIGVFIGIFNL